MDDWAETISQSLVTTGAQVERGVRLAERTTFRIGGPVGVWCRVGDEVALVAALRFCREHNLQVWVIGRGSNVLVSDQGLSGVVIQLTGRLAIINQGCTNGDWVEVEVGAGTRLDIVADYCEQQSLVGAEFLAGIPGTIGGGLCSNAGAFGSSLADLLVAVEGVNRTGEYCRLARTELTAGYRKRLIPADMIATRATLRLRKGLPRPTTEEIRQLRWQKHPTEASAGSFFRNPELINERVPAGRLIDEAGLKGRRLGRAQVSEKHANFIVNTGGATCTEVLELVEIIKTRVEATSGVLLEEEVELLPSDGRG